MKIRELFVIAALGLTLVGGTGCGESNEERMKACLLKKGLQGIEMNTPFGRKPILLRTDYQFFPRYKVYTQYFDFESKEMVLKVFDEYSPDKRSTEIVRKSFDQLTGKDLSDVHKIRECLECSMK
ncbi:MAG: hypothetical protein PHY92_03395 [Alphaproteobacteria bacterium]|nr:hypothetical protein [Alphaproteobacteria bacterium]